MKGLAIVVLFLVSLCLLVETPTVSPTPVFRIGDSVEVEGIGLPDPDCAGLWGGWRQFTRVSFLEKCSQLTPAGPAFGIVRDDESGSYQNGDYVFVCLYYEQGCAWFSQVYPVAGD